MALVLSFLGGLDGRPVTEASPGARDTGVSATRGGHLGADSTLRDVLHHPSFAGFSRLLLPWDDRAYDEQMPLTRIGSLLPYHTHLDPETVVARMLSVVESRLGKK
jgi:hypothetical protein